MAVRLKKRERKKVPNYTYLGCPLTKNRSPWCFHMCTPVKGRGLCGRIAPHSHLGRTREAILRHKVKAAGM